MGSKSNKAQAAAMAQAAEESRRARELLASVELPDELKIEQLISQLEAPELVGLLQAEQLGDTSLAGINLDPALRQQQMQLLEGLKQRADEGLTSEDRARISEFRRMSAGDEQARQASILQNMAERGIAGGGNELAARLASSQASADREAQAGMQMAAQANQARMAALQGASDQAGRIRSQDYGEQENMARARDAIAQFNAMNRQSTAQQNLSERQRIAEAQTGTRNLQTQQRMGQEQQSFENRYRKAGGQAQASQNMANMYMQQAQMMPEKRGLGGALGTIGGAALGGVVAAKTGQDPLKGMQVGGGLGGVLGAQSGFKDGGKKYMNGSELSINPDGSAMENREKAADLNAAGRGTLEPRPDYLGMAQDIVSNMPSQDQQVRKELLPALQTYDLTQSVYKNGGSKKMAYNDGGEGTIIDSGMEMYAGDELPDRINDGEVVLNVKQQDELMKLLKDYKRLRMLHDGVEKGKRIDDKIMEGELGVNRDAQEMLMAVARGELDPVDMPDVSIVESEDEE